MQAQPLRAYLERVRAKIEELEQLISSVSLHTDQRGPTRLVLKGTIIFINGTKLHFLEYISAEDNILERIVYRFHYVKPDNKLIFRYDNAPHHPELETFPHRKHLANGTVVASEEQTLPRVLDEIKALVLRVLRSFRGSDNT